MLRHRLSLYVGLMNIGISARLLKSRLKGYTLGDSGKLGTVNIMTHSTEVMIKSGNSLPNLVYDLTGASSFTKGYALGGRVIYLADYIQGVIFSSESLFTSANTLVASIYASASTFEYETAAYIARSYYQSFIPTDSISKLVFSTEVDSTMSATMSPTFRARIGQAQSYTSGYYLGGILQDGVVSDLIEALQFSSETIRTLTSKLSSAATASAISISEVASYSLGGVGLNGALMSTAQKFVFSTETASTLTAGLPNSNFNAAATYSHTKGYSISGSRGARVDGIKFSDETIATTSAVAVSVILSIGVVS